MKYFFSLLMLGLSLHSCKCPDKTTSAMVTTATQGTDSAAALRQNEETILSQPVHRLSVSFISIGEGVDSRAKGMMDDYINNFEAEHKVDVTYASKPWGREGESDHYFMLEGLTDEQQAVFVEGMKKTFAGNQLIIIQENRENKSKN